MKTLIVEAIKGKKLLKFFYEGGYRTVEPHCYGLTTANNEGLRAFQISGYSSTGSMGWKMFDLSKASSIQSLEETFTAPRTGYKRNDKGMSVVYCEL